MKPNLMVSACLGFSSCRYDGSIIPNTLTRLLQKHVNIITLCPEEKIGLGTPRKPVRLIRDEEVLVLYQPATKKRLSQKIDSCAREFADGHEDLDGFLFKSSSPTCGPYGVRVYDSFKEKSNFQRGEGIFVGKMRKAFPHCALEDEHRLTNLAIREHFLTKLFTNARLREAIALNTIAALSNFHARHKYLFLACNETCLRKLGKIVASYKNNLSEIQTQYKQEFVHMMEKLPKRLRFVNVADHIYSGMRKKLTAEEKKHFRELVQEYRDERIEFSTLAQILYSWAIRFDVSYLKDQIVFQPYPRELSMRVNSGATRKF